MLKLEQRAEQTRVVLQPAQGDEPEAFIVLDPITPKMRRRCLRAWRDMLEREGVEFEDAVKAHVELQRDMGELVSRELMRMGASEWGGIGGADGEPVELTPDQATRIRTANDPERPTGTIDLLLDDEGVFNAIDEAYVRPDAIRRAEKNGLSGSPNGTSAVATPAKDIANSRAKRRKTAAARNAPTKRKRSKPTKAKRSGKS